MVLVLLRRPGTKVNSSISRADINIIAIEMQQFCGVASSSFKVADLNFGCATFSHDILFSQSQCERQ